MKFQHISVKVASQSTRVDMCQVYDQFNEQNINKTNVVYLIKL